MSEFEAEVLRQFSWLAKTVSDGDSKVHKRIDSFSKAFSNKFEEFGRRLERAATETEANTKEMVGLKEDLQKHIEADDRLAVLIKKQGAAAPVEAPEIAVVPRKPFAITTDDIKSFFKILPFIVAFGTAIAGGISQLRDEPPPINVPSKSRVAVEGTDEAR